MSLSACKLKICISECCHRLRRYFSVLQCYLSIRLHLLPHTCVIICVNLPIHIFVFVYVPFVAVYMRMLLLLLLGIMLVSHFVQFTHFLSLSLSSCYCCVYSYFCANLFVLSSSNALMLIKVDIFGSFGRLNKFQVIIIGEETNWNLLILWKK